MRGKKIEKVERWSWFKQAKRRDFYIKNLM
jgi:hypothetical protein